MTDTSTTPETEDETRARRREERVDAASAELTEAGKRPPILLAIGGAIKGFDDYATVIAGEDGSDIPDPTVGRSMLYTSGTTGRPKGVDRSTNSAAAAAAETVRNP